MTKETAKKMQDAKGKFEIEVNGYGVNFTADHCNGAAWIIAIYSMVDRLSKVTALSENSIFELVKGLADSATAIEAESKAQLDVMNEIYKQRLEQ